MKTGPIVVARILAWAVATVAVCAVLLQYESLPDAIPLTRWTSAPKSLLIALRIPLINLFTLGLIEVLLPCLRRVQGFDHAESVVTVPLLTIAAKAGLEGVGILLLPMSFSWTLLPLVIVISAGLIAAAVLGRTLLHFENWRQLQMTRLETAVALALVTGIATFNFPLFLQ